MNRANLKYLFNFHVVLIYLLFNIYESYGGERFTDSINPADNLESIAESIKAPYGHRTLFRYRTYEGSRPSWVSPHETDGGIIFNTSNDIDETIRGSGFESFLSTDFNGSNEYLGATESINTIDDAGHDSFTIQAWFMAHSVSGYRCLVSNTQSYNGFSLKILNGQLRGLVRLNNNGNSINAEILGGQIEPNKWYYAAFRVKEYPNGENLYNLKLYINSDEVASQNFSHYDGIRQSAEPPMVGAEPSNSEGVDSFFDGLIYAVSITNYAVGTTNYLQNDLIRDGSRYFGMVSYHDYLTEMDGPDHRISNTINSYPDLDILTRFKYYCPFLNDQYCPQGIATDGYDKIYMTMYWIDKDGNYGPGTKPSILVEMNKNGTMIRCMQLKDNYGQDFFEHVGGVAYWNNYIYIPDSNDILRFNLDDAQDYIFNKETFYNPQFYSNTLSADTRYYDCNIAPNIENSCISCTIDMDGTPVLWVCDFDESTTNMKYIIGFAIDENNHIDPGVRFRGKSFELPVNKVQGLACYHSEEGDYRFVISRSLGDNPSQLYDVIYISDFISYGELMEGPAGFEDLEMYGNHIWTVSESGAKYYQKRDTNPWTDLFPFIFSIGVGDPFLCGDVNDNEMVNILDVAFLINYLYKNGKHPTLYAAGDVNNDGAINIMDITYLIAYLYKDGPEPDCP